jgi:hypothetical protein
LVKVVLAKEKQQGDCAQHTVLTFQYHENNALEYDTIRDYKHAIALSFSTQSAAVRRSMISLPEEIIKHRGLKMNSRI